MTDHPDISTLGELRAADLPVRTLRDELRANLLDALAEGRDPWPGLHGLSRTVLPQVERALIAGHDIVLLGERGQGKTRLLRTMVGLLDEWSPEIEGSELHEHPLDPITDAARARKVADRIHETVARLLQGRIKDPRLGFVTVTDVRVTGDLQQATVFYTVYGSDEEREETAKALRSAKGLIRSEVGKALGIRLTPSLTFQLDALPTQAKSFDDALARARAKDEEIARAHAGASYAGEEDPYRVPREDVDDDLEDDSEEPDADDEVRGGTTA